MAEPLPAPAAAASERARHDARVHAMLRVGSILVASFCAGWGVFFALRGVWLVLPLDLVGVASAAVTLGLVRQRRTRAASRLFTVVVYLLMVVNAVFLDVPNGEMPRTVHVFLVGQGVASLVLMRGERSLLRHGVPVLFFLTYGLLSSITVGPESALALPDTIRVPGAWVNNAFSVVLIYTSLLVFQSDTAERHGARAELKAAIEGGQLEVLYQPQVGTDGRVIGAEALVRWRHPQRGVVSPAEFIPLAEDCGLMPALGEAVMRQACAQLAAWRARGPLGELRVAVNVSMSQLFHAEFVRRVERCIGDTGISPSRLKLELTESTFAQDLDGVVGKMTALRSIGIGFSLDDFGTGFSSLTYLRRLPLEQLKIDQSFVRNMLVSRPDAEIVRTVIRLGQTLELDVIAEGVETEEQRAFLEGMGCSTWQGYLFGRPMPAADLEALVMERALGAGGVA